MLGPALGGVIGTYFGPRAPFLAAACFTLLNWLYGFFVLPESLAPENRRKFDWRRANPIGSLKLLFRYPVIIGLVISIFLIYLSAHAVQSTWTFYTIEKFQWSLSQISFSLFFVGLMVAIIQGGLIRIIIPKLGQVRSVYIGLGLYALGFLLFGIAYEGWMMYPFTIIYCFGGIAGASLQGIMTGQVPPNEQGELQGALTSLVSLTSIFGPLVMTSLFTYFTVSSGLYFPGAPMYMGALLTIISAIMARASLKKNLAK